MKKKRVYVDMDNVACDFVKATKKELSLNPNRKYPHSKFGFFSELEPMPEFLESWKTLERAGYDLWILTRPSIMNINCYSEKAFWIEKYLGHETLNRTVYACDKSIAKGDFLVDDSTEFGQTEFEGEFIHFGQYPFEDWVKVTNYLLNLQK